MKNVSPYGTGRHETVVLLDEFVRDYSINLPFTKTRCGDPTGDENKMMRIGWVQLLKTFKESVLVDFRFFFTLSMTFHSVRIDYTRILVLVFATQITVIDTVVTDVV